MQVSKPVLYAAPASLVLSVADAKTFLRVDGSTEDNLIQAQIKGATQRLEALTDRKFFTQTWDIFYDTFPFSYSDEWWDGVREGTLSQFKNYVNHLDLPFGPLQSVTGVYTYDDGGTETTFSSTNYVIDNVGPYGKVVLKSGSVWPTDQLRTVNGVKVRAVFGWATVPDDIIEALKQLVAVMYEHRGDELPKIPATVSMLVEPYRRFKVGC